MPRASGPLDRKRMRNGTQLWMVAQTVKIKIIDAKLGESLIKLLLYLVGLMSVVPELGGDEELLALDNRRNDFLQSTADLILILVDHREVEVTVSIADSDFDLDCR